MKSSIAERVLKRFNKQFQYYYSWTSFHVGLGFCKTTGFIGWKYMLSFDLGFISIWIYFVKIKKYENIDDKSNI